MPAARPKHILLTVVLWGVLSVVATLLTPNGAKAEVTAMKQAIAEAAARDADIAAFYRTNGYQSVWVGKSNRERTRRAQLLKALGEVEMHGLPAARYDAKGLKAQMQAAKTPRDLGKLEVAISAVFLRYARDIQTGMLVPARIDEHIVRQVPYRDRSSYLVNFTKSSPAGFFHALPPKTREYTALMKERLRMEKLVARGGWGQTVPTKVLKPGASGNSVAILRNRLIAMGFLKRTNTQTYDAAITAAVQDFQTAHGLEVDGVAGEATMQEINVQADARLQSIIVAMERERWMNHERGKRHILVNIPDFTAKIVDNGKVTFQTRSVVGARQNDRRTPEFSDVMEHMIINPSWHVPRSIATKEYLPALQKNPNAVSHLILTDSRGRRVNRAETDFTQFTARTFPFAMRQAPSTSNALGLVKFMFPNKHNIYLHDTPHKKLFARETRAYSHGCVRLNDPFDFAYALLAKQSRDPKGLFQSTLKSGKETQIDLEQKVPVHLIYRTALTNNKGRAEYRRDVYGRDAKIWRALSDAGVVLGAVRG